MFRHILNFTILEYASPFQNHIYDSESSLPLYPLLSAQRAKRQMLLVISSKIMKAGISPTDLTNLRFTEFNFLLHDTYCLPILTCFSVFC